MRLERKDYLRRHMQRSGKSMRKVYVATPLGYKAAARARAGSANCSLS
jgi:hypothetical protein